MFRAVTLSSFAAAAFALAGSAQANLISNPSFETGAVGGAPTGHAFSPAPWTSSAPGNGFINWDTFHNSGTTALPPSFAGTFTGALAAHGERWAAGWTFEEMGQILSGGPLTPGGQYTISAQVRPAFTHFGSFEFWIGTGPSSPVSMLTSFTQVASGAWHFQTANFTAPANAASNPWFLIKGYSIAADGTPQQAYIGIDDMFMDRVPAPGSLALLGGAGLLSIRRRR